jgi:tetratricopeptide (TPR) repeat protein
MTLLAPLLSRRLWPILAALAIIVLWAIFLFSRDRVHPLVSSPDLILRQVNAKSLYYNAQARPFLISERPDMISAEERDERSAKTRGLIQAVQNPKLFRQLDRQYRFDAVLLIGDPSQYRPLLEHLLESKDFSLTYLDHSGVIYAREANASWKPDELAKVEASLEGATNADRVRFLSNTASKLLAVRQNEAARKVIERARDLGGSMPDAWGMEAQYRLALGQWEAAVSAADRALQIDDDWMPALAAKAQAFYATKHFADAFDVSQRLIDLNPQDPGLLFYHAKISHEARAFTEEIRVMKRLLELAEKEQRPTSGYRLYLAQAYASDGQGEPAIEQFRLAMEDPDLPKDQRQFAQDTIAQIKNRLGLR